MDTDGNYQRVSFLTQNDAVDRNPMRVATKSTRYKVLTGAEGVVDEVEEDATLLNEYRHIRVDQIHGHEFTYAVKDNDPTTIVATCAGGKNQQDCPLTNRQAEVQIVAPEHTVYGDGKPSAAKIVDQNHIRNAEKVKYFIANNDGTGIQESWTSEQDDSPVNAGKYVAQITFNGKEGNTATAQVIYTIAKTPEVTKTGEASVEAGETIDLSGYVFELLGIEATDARTQSAEVHFESTATLDCMLSGTQLTAGDKDGTVVVKVEVPADANHEKLTATITVTILPKPKQTINANPVTVTFGDTGKKVAATVTGNKEGMKCGELSYAVSEGYE